MKKVHITFLIICLMLPAACNSEKAAESDGGDTGKEVSKTAETKTEETGEKVEESEEETNEEVIAEDTVEEYPPIPTPFEKTVEYPLIGEFAGVEFTNQPEIIDALDSIPRLTRESTEEEVENWKRYLWALFNSFSKEVSLFKHVKGLPQW